MGDLLTLETGLSCNNRCGFCPQPPLRACGPGWRDPVTAEMRRRIEEARARGFRELAFSGGEPTLRPDLPDLISLARRLGFQRVSVTTNGRRLVYRDYARTLLDAGLTGISVSLHGPEEAVHDGLTGVPGSFQQAVRGLRVISEMTARWPERFDRNTITLIVPENAGRLRETLVLAGGLGASLHVVQPFILSRETLGVAARFLMDRDSLVKALREALEEPLPHRGRVKPYNLPPCLFPDLEDRLEVQQYGLKTWRMHRGDFGTGRSEVSGQFWKDGRCVGCPARCPGHRLEHLPMDEMVRGILGAVEGAVAAHSRQREWVLSGLDLLTVEALAEVLRAVRALCPGEVRLLWGGIGRTGPQDFLQRAQSAGVSEVCLVVHPEHRRLPDRAAWVPGNLEVAREVLALWKRESGLPRPSVLVPLGALLDEDWRMTEADLRGLVRLLLQAGGSRWFLVAPETMDPLVPGRPVNDLPGGTDAVSRLVDSLRTEGEPWLVRSRGMPVPTGQATLEDLVARLLPAVSWETFRVAHPFSGNAMGWVSWSEPLWLGGETETGQTGIEPQSPPSTAR